MKFTDAQIDYVRRVIAIKRRIAARLAKLPTNEQLAEEIGCTERYVERIAAQKVRVVPRGTPVAPAEIDQLARELQPSA